MKKYFNWKFVAEYGTSYFQVINILITGTQYILRLKLCYQVPFLRNSFITCNVSSQMSRQIVNQPHQRHYSCVLIMQYLAVA